MLLQHLFCQYPVVIATEKMRPRRVSRGVCSVYGQRGPDVGHAVAKAIRLGAAVGYRRGADLRHAADRPFPWRGESREGGMSHRRQKFCAPRPGDVPLHLGAARLNCQKTAEAIAVMQTAVRWIVEHVACVGDKVA